MIERADAIFDREEIKRVGRSGQISLGKGYAGKTLRLERFKDGRIVLTAVRMVPESQIGPWPCRSRIEQGLAWAAGTKPSETDLDTLLTRQGKRARNTRVKKS